MMQENFPSHVDHDALLSLLHHKGTAVYGIDGVKIGVVSDHGDPDYLVVKTGFLWLTRDIYIPPDAIAGSDDRSIYLKYSRAEIMSLYPERPEQHPNIGTVLDEARQRSAADVEREIRTQSAEHPKEPDG
jgi:hypothetical protein